MPIVWLASSFVGSGNRVNRSGPWVGLVPSLWAAFTNDFGEALFEGGIVLL